MGHYPLLVGDVLLTGGRKPSPQSLPTIGLVPTALADDFGISISGVRQKVNVLHDHLALAWAGNFITAHALATRLRQSVESDGPSTERLVRIVQDNGADLACILLILEGQQTHYLWHNTQSIDLTQFKHIRFAGSGSDYFVRTVSKLDTSHPISEAPSTFHPIGTALTIASQCIGREMFTLNSLLESWGGAIEICFPVDGKLHKLNNVAFLQVIYDSDGSQEGFGFVPRILLNQYHADTLHCRAISFTTSNDYGGTNELLVESDHTTIVQPLLTLSSPLVARRADHQFKYDYLCTYLSYRRHASPGWSMSFVNACPNGSGPLEVRFDGQRASVTIADTLKDQMRAAVMDYENHQSRH
jgi:hypothetical protein